MKRREFITLIGGAATWPLAVRAQQAERVRRVGLLSILGTDDPEAHARAAVFEQTLEQLGWSVGRDLKIETRQIGGDVDNLRRYAAELVALAPDVILSVGSITRVRAVIDKNLHSTIHTSDLSAVARRSAAHFARSFKHTFGESPHAYLMRRRLEKACHLMMTSSEF